ncbi:MAG: EamA/RhaT family transporter [Candidatus Melainabacteria bacterium HGW-Melainabacteria-1]|nr:MAG: EamA/RhaT family transporter [Candidatus Melainabacteria bacterium HGW-Melainabacteria-1]
MDRRTEKSQLMSGYLFALGSTAIWAGNFAIARALNQSITPITLAFLRWTVAAIAILPFALKYLIAERALIRKHFPYSFITAALGIALFNTLIYFAGQSTTSVNMSLISVTFPIFIIILSRLFYGEKITINKVAGIALVISGVLILITKGKLSSLLSISFAPGDAIMLLAAFTFAVYSILLRHRPKEMSLWTLQASTFIVGAIILFPFFLWDRSTAPAIQVNAGLVLAVLYIGIMASLTAFVLWNKAIERIGASPAAMVYYTMPLISGVLAFFVLGERISIIHAYSLLLILPGILLANRRK